MGNKDPPIGGLELVLFTVERSIVEILVNQELKDEPKRVRVQVMDRVKGVLEGEYS